MSPFALLCRAAGLPEPETEFLFCEGRRFRFDYCWPEIMAALEIEGGLFGRGKKCPLCGRKAVGAHSSIERLKSDMEKYNEAAVAGWRVFRVTPEQFNDGTALRWLERMLK